MASRKLIVEVLVDPKQAQRGFAQTSRSAKTFERDLSHASRGALAGSGVFRSLGRSLAFASGGFLAFASAGQFIRKSIDAAKDAQVTQAQLAQQLQNSGKSFSDYRDEIDKTNLAISGLAGFTKDDLDASLTTILRTVPNVSKALRDNALAADLARARHISLAQASLVIAKTEAGNTTLLRRQGFQIAKNATAEQALAKVRSVVAGQARAGTTEQERFGAVLHDTEVIIGNGLLPSLNKFLISGTKWLQQMNESGKLQRDVASAAKTVGSAFNDLRSVIKVVDKVTGGFKNTLELLIGLKIASSLAGMATSIGLVGGSAVVAEGEVAGFSGALGILASINPIVIPITLAFAVDRAGLGKGVENLPGDLLKAIKDPSKQSFVNALIGSPGHRSGIVGRLFPGTKQQNGGDFGDLLPKPTPDRGFRDANLRAATAAAAKASGLTAKQRNTFFDNALTRSLDRVQDLGLSQQITRLQQIGALITKRIAATKDITRKLNLEDQLVGVNRQIKGVREQIAQNVATRIDAQKAALAERVAKAREVAAAAAAARQANQFKALGLSATGEQIIPVRVIHNELDRLTGAVKGTLLDTDKTRSLFANIRKIFAGGFGAITKDTKAQIKTLLDGIDEQLKTHRQTTRFRHASSTAILAGLGLSPDQIRNLRSRLTQIGPGGTVPGERSAAFAGAGASNPITVNLIADGKKLASVVTPHQQRASQRRSVSRSGPYAGRH